MTVESEIAAFFVDYVEAFARGDAEAVSQLWDEVALFPLPGRNVAMDRRAFRNHCATLMDFYRQQGVVRPEGELLSITGLFPNVAQARMAYRMKGEGDTLIAEWEHIYILRRKDHWRVSLTIADSEIAAWAGKGAQF